MQAYLLLNLSELAQRRAIAVREEAQLWDILARDLKREAKRREEIPNRRETPAEVIEEIHKATEAAGEKLFVRIPEASRMMGISRSSIYIEINSGRLKVKKCGRNTLIATADIQAWAANLSD